MVYGAITLSADNAKLFDAEIDQWRCDTNMRREMKWTKAKAQKLEEYKSFVDLFFDRQKVHRLRFKAIVFDTTHIDENYNEGGYEIGFYKFYYHFLLHEFGYYARDDTHRLYVYLDQRSTRYNVRGLRLILDNGIKKKNQLAIGGIVKTVEPLASERSNLLQMADVLMGGIGWEFNGLGNRPEASPAKIALAAHVAKRAKLRTLGNSTVRGKYDFKIWRWKFSETKERSDA